MYYNFTTGALSDYPLIIRKKKNQNPIWHVYYSHTDVRMTTSIFSPKLKNYYSFISTDGTLWCPSAGLKLLKLDKESLLPVDSAFYCDNNKPSAGSGFYLHNQFYVISQFDQGFMGSGIVKRRSLLRRIDTNMVMLNQKVILDTSISFNAYVIHESINDKNIILNGQYDKVNESYNPMLIKLDSLGNEIWRKHYYHRSTNQCSIKGVLIGLHPYDNGYIGLFNFNFASCNTNNLGYYYGHPIMVKMDKECNIIKEVQYTCNGDTTLEFNSSLLDGNYRAAFLDFLIKTNEGNYATVLSGKSCDISYWNTDKNYIVILDTNLNIIHRSPSLGKITGTSWQNFLHTPTFSQQKIVLFICAVQYNLIQIMPIPI